MNTGLNIDRYEKIEDQASDLGNVKDRPVQLRVSQEEYEIIKEKASKLGMSVSAFLRFVGINADISILLEIDK